MRGRIERALDLDLALSLAVVVPTAAEARTLYATTGGGRLLTFLDRTIQGEGREEEGQGQGIHQEGEKGGPGDEPAGRRLAQRCRPGWDRLPARRASCSKLVATASIYRVLLNETDKAQRCP